MVLFIVNSLFPDIFNAMINKDILIFTFANTPPAQNQFFNREIAGSKDMHILRIFYLFCSQSLPRKILSNLHYPIRDQDDQFL